MDTIIIIILLHQDGKSISSANQPSLLLFQLHLDLLGSMMDAIIISLLLQQYWLLFTYEHPDCINSRSDNTLIGSL